MPSSSPHPCAEPGCAALIRGRARCEVHTKQKDKSRGTAAERGYDHHWHQARTAYLLTHPLCILCEREGTLTPATVVDHIIPHHGDNDLMWNQENWQPLCASHHGRKTATQDHGFGR